MGPQRNEGDGDDSRIDKRRIIGWCVTAIALIAWSTIRSWGSDNTPDHSAPCERTPSRYTQIVDRALDGPSLPRLPTASDRRYPTFARQEAERFGLRLSNPAREIAAVRRARTAAAVLRALNAYTSPHFGFTVSLLPRPVASEAGVRALPVRRGRESFAELRAGSQAFMRYLSLVPTGLVAYSGLQHFTLVGALHDSLGNIDEGAAVPDERTIYLTLRTFSTDVRATASHELGHLLDAAVCGGVGGWSNDPQYAALNPPGFMYLLAFNSEDVASEEGGLSVVEDKASEFENMLGGLQKRFFDSDNAVLRAKYRLLLARLEEHVPGSARYYAAMSLHASPSAGTSSLLG